MRYVIALGGNALDGASIRPATKMIEELAAKGHEIVVTHGNGPQVGELAELEDKSLAILTAQTEAEIGLAIENSMPSLRRRIATVITRSLVDPRDTSLKHPSKPIGKVLTKRQAGEMKERGFSVTKTLRGFRRTVPSPVPREILELDFIRTLLESGYVVIAGGGGGVPITITNGKVNYEEAVIDKDHASALIASRLKADRLIILTSTDGAYTDFKTKRAKRIGRISALDINAMLDDGEFEDGSMGPKVEACIDFVDETGSIAIIGNLSKPKDALAMRNVTVVVPP